MSNKFSFFCIFVVLILIFSNIVIAKEVNMKWGHCQSPDHPSNIAMNAISKEVAEKTNGKITIDIYPASQLGNAKDMIEGLIMGTQDMAFDGPVVMSGFLPKISIFDAPYLYKGFEHSQRVVNSEIAKSLFDELLKTKGIRILDVWYYGLRHITTKGKTINSTEDLKGLKLRVSNTPLMIDIVRALGANPTPMAGSEIYLALQTGAVDGQENPLAVIDSMKFYEVQDTVTLSGHVTNLQFVMISEKTWNKLSEGEQDILVDAVKKAGNSQNKIILEGESKLVENFKKLGLRVVEIDKTILKEDTKEVYKKYSNIWGSELMEKIMEIE